MNKKQYTLKARDIDLEEYSRAEILVGCIWCGEYMSGSKRQLHPQTCPYFQEFIRQKKGN